MIVDDRYRPIRAAGLLVALLATAACGDLLSVDNPSSILEDDLNTPQGVSAVAAGVAGDFNGAYTRTAFWVALLSDEMLHVGTAAIYRNASLGEVQSLNTAYNDLAKARWVADDAVRRFRDLLPDADSRSETASARVYGGYSLLMLADNYCRIPLDGGAPSTPTQIYAEAEARFDEALTIAQAAGATALRNQALLGRARARLMTGNNQGARGDAAQVPQGFIFESIHSETPGNQNNEFPYQTVSEIRREISVHPRIYEDERFANDPRMPIINRGPSYLGTDGGTQFVEQRKYVVRSSNMQIGSWQEARLIEAEAALRLGDLEDTAALINVVRSAAGLPAYAGAISAGALQEQLIAERTAELYLEGQRLNDQRRFSDPFLAGRAACYDVSQSEKDANPHLD